jgi:glycosyltransferase involved in cell wall biosynthesis
MSKIASPQVITKLVVSLVIPVRDESHTIQDLLRSVNAQTYRPTEIIFVDGGSADDTVSRLRKASAFDARIRIVEAGEATPGRGRNLGIAAAENEWIALTDAGIRLEPTWLERLVDVLERDPELAVVYGNFEPITGSFFERCAALAYPPPKTLRDGRLMRGPFIASSLIHRKVWESVGKFPDLRAAEDLIFMDRIAEAGFKTGWAADATVWWQLRPGLISTFRKFALYSKHNVWAGMQRHWHYNIARQYLVWTICFLLAAIHSWWWLPVPVLGYAARVGKGIWVRREGRGFWWALNPIQFACVAGILLTIDMAMFVGWGEALLKKR